MLILKFIRKYIVRQPRFFRGACQWGFLTNFQGKRNILLYLILKKYMDFEEKVYNLYISIESSYDNPRVV